MKNTSRRRLHPPRAQLTSDTNPLRSEPQPSALSPEEWITYVLKRYPLPVALEMLGLEPSRDRRNSGSARHEKRLKEVLAAHPSALTEDILGLLKQLYGSARSDDGVAVMSDQEWETYVRTQLPRRLVRELDGIRQTAAAAGRTESWRRPKRRRNPLHIGIPQAENDRRARYLAHTVLLVVSIVIMGRNPAPVVLVGAFGLSVAMLLLAAKDAAKFAFTFTMKSRSRTATVDIRVRVNASTWDGIGGARVLRLLSKVLPREYRAEYLEEQLANLMAAESPSERTEYLWGLIESLPGIARQFYAERRRQSAK